MRPNTKYSFVYLFLNSAPTLGKRVVFPNISLLREYIDREFRSIQSKLGDNPNTKYDFKCIMDDWVWNIIYLIPFLKSKTIDKFNGSMFYV